MMKSNKIKPVRSLISAITAAILAASLLAVPAAAEEQDSESTSSTSAIATSENPADATADTTEENDTKPEAGTIDLDSDWISFFLICNEGMSDRGGNSGNTLMVMAMNQKTGKIRLAPFGWDTFMQYEGYDAPQRMDMAYRNGGPEEAIKVFNANMDTDINLFMSLNFLNLATLINDYGGVIVDVSRAERNALNGMVSSKKEDILNSEDSTMLSEMAAEMLAEEYYLNEFGEETHLNGLQAAGYGWLQYDSVYNCCHRDAEVIGNLFKSLGESMSEQVVFYTNEYDVPEVTDSRRIINLDELTEEDEEFLKNALAPIFDTSYNNLPEESTMKVAEALARASYLASRQGIDIMDQLEYEVFPLELTEPVDKIAGAEGHSIDYEANAKALNEFLYAE